MFPVCHPSLPGRTFAENFCIHFYRHVCVQRMALVATLDLTNYLQAASPSTLTEPARYSKNKCALAYSRSSVDLLRTASSYCNILRPRSDDHRNGSLWSRSGHSAVDSAAGGSWLSNNSSEDKETKSVSSSSTSARPRSTRKRVWFADEAGRDLVTIRRYEVHSPTPTVDDPLQRHPGHRRLRLEPAFRQPWLDPGALRCRIDGDTVALESVSSRGRGLSFSGTVLVANIAFHKRVTVRCTFNGWNSFVDVTAGYVSASVPGTDLFAFQVQQPDSTTMIERLPRRFEFAVRYQYRAHSDIEWTERWDNNVGQNYQMLVTW